MRELALKETKRTRKQNQTKPPKPRGRQLSTSLPNTTLDSLKSVPHRVKSALAGVHVYTVKIRKCFKSGFCSPESWLLNIYQHITLSENQCEVQVSEFQGLEEQALDKNNIASRGFTLKRSKRSKKKKGGGTETGRKCMVVETCVLWWWCCLVYLFWFIIKKK